MPWMKWLPWRFLIRRVARSHGFLDPMAVVSRLHSFAQPSEVREPVELIRAGVVFHARGLINSRVIQHNQDWVWPYWVERQFDPKDDAFVPRAFSITHVNLTHRNWTAIGLPDVSELPIVDPRGLLTPFLDSWSLDCWILTADGQSLLPSRALISSQRLENDCLAVITETHEENLYLKTHASVQAVESGPICNLRIQAHADKAAWAVLALRPYNPEGISFIHTALLSTERNRWTIDGKHTVEFSATADRHHVSDYRSGDVYIHLRDLADNLSGECDVGMVTAAAMFKLEPNQTRELLFKILIEDEAKKSPAPTISWEQSLQGHCRLQIPDRCFQSLYDVALQTLILHSPEDVYPGPYTYKRFWFRDAAFIIHGLLCAGLIQRAERALDRFPSRQAPNGYFHSQEGEWDSNGEALWIMRRFCELTDRPPKPGWQNPIRRGGHWIKNKRLSAESGVPHAGLLPAGFSAEHLGPNDYYYWDDFWGIAGLQSAACLAGFFDEAAGETFNREAKAFTEAVDQSLTGVADRLGRPAMPASPYRRLDAGAIGSLAVGYPLQQCAPDDARLLDTVKFLLDHCFVNGGFFQDMIHSGINAYLTLHVAQVLLRADDPRYLELMDTVAALASPTGQWPEAIHPRTGGGCMGDGQHVWAAAEWVLMLRNCFVREESGRLILCQGVARRWLQSGAEISFGPAPTTFGAVSVNIEVNETEPRVRVTWQGEWHAEAPDIEVRLPGFKTVVCTPRQQSVELPLEGSE
ncbi:MAG: hypothetical protein OEZ51_14780 [Nitrospinota bacterium]|nr:hypothetical protein [Nitrospinota bacterium]